MAIQTKTKRIRICDMCGKEEGKHLKSSDFYDEAPIVSIKNYDGVTMNFQLNVDCWPTDEEYELDEKLGDVIGIHGMYSQSPQITQVIPIGSMLQTNMINNSVEQPEYVVCKQCYKIVVDMITKCGKFDEVEEF